MEALLGTFASKAREITAGAVDAAVALTSSEAKAAAASSSRARTSKPQPPHAAAKKLDVPVIYDDEGCDDSGAENQRRRGMRRPRSCLMVASPPQPSLWNPTYTDSGRRNWSMPTAAASSSSADGSDNKSKQRHRTRRNRRIGGNCPLLLSQFVGERRLRHKQQILFVQLDDHSNDRNSSSSGIPDDRTLTLLQRQIVVLKAFGAPADESKPDPTISPPPPSHRTLPPYLLVWRTCYVLSAWLNVANASHSSLESDQEENGEGKRVEAAWGVGGQGNDGGGGGVLTPAIVMYCCAETQQHRRRRRHRRGSRVPRVGDDEGGGNPDDPDGDREDESSEEDEGDDDEDRRRQTQPLRDGKSTCALVAACWLRYSRQVETVREGLEHVLKSMLGNRGGSNGNHDPSSSTSYWESVPPSVRNYLGNFELLVDRGGCYPNVRPLLLRAISIQGLPVDRAPVIEVWGHVQHEETASQRCALLYTSSRRADISSRGADPLLLLGVSTTSNDTSSSRGGNGGPCQWAEEEGFFELGNVVLEGEFSVVVKFGDDDITDDETDEEMDQHDSVSSSRVILRYVGHAGFLQPGIHDLDATQVDVVRQYESEILYEGSDFLLSVVLDADWSLQPDSDAAQNKHIMNRLSVRRKPSDASPILPLLVPYGARAQDRGWQLIAKHHAAQPSPDDVRHFRLVSGMDGTRHPAPPDHFVSLALQLANYDVPSAQDWLMHRFYHWWSPPPPPTLATLPPLAADGSSAMPPPTSMEDKRKAMLRILERAGVKLPSENTKSATHPAVPGVSKAAMPFPVVYESPLLVPHPGDVYNTFRKARDPYALFPVRTTRVTRDAKPMFPVHRPAPYTPAPSELDNPRNAAAAETLMKIQHAGITLDDLLDLSKAMKTWTPEHDAKQRAVRTGERSSGEGDNDSNEVAIDASTHLASQSPTVGVDSSIADVPTSDIAVDGEDGALQDECYADCPMRDDPRFEKYFRMLDKGLPEGAVRNALQRGGLDPSIVDMDPSKSYASQTASATQGLRPADVPLRDDPRFEKYFRMLAKGLPEGAVRNALQRDGVEVALLDLDPNRSLESQTGVATPEVQLQDTDGGAPALKDDPRFEKYFRMLAKGLPEGAVRNALARDGVEIALLDLDPNKSLESQTGVTPDVKETDGGAPALKDDPRFEKYFRMLAKGLPEGAVRNALERDGVKIALLDLDPNKSLESQTGATPAVKETEGGAPALKDDPRFEKYFRMLAKGLPEGAVRNALLRDGVETAILELDPNRSLESQTDSASKVQETNGGAPVVDVDQAKNESSQTPSKRRIREEAALKNDPKYEKYFRMIEKGLPMGAVRNALQRDGLDASVLDLDGNRSLVSQTSLPTATPTKDTGIPLCEDPDWKKYFTMLKMGLPLGAVKNAVIRDGKDPAFMDLDPNKSIEFQLESIGIKLPTSAKKKKRVRRKKIYWTPIDPGQVKEDSLWSIVRGKVQMSRLKYDIQEFEDLFTESADPGDQNRKQASLGVKKVKKSVQVIDGKRSMNGGIILLRLKMDYKVIAKMVDEMEVGNLDATQLQALKENLPTAEERKGLLEYMNGTGLTEEEKRAAYVQLSECEKYMLTMIEVENAAEKFDCMLYRVQFKPRLTEILDAIRTVETACNEVRNSEKLREIMAMILSLVNEINTGGDGKMAVGFSLDALLKLNDAKAFDRKTSVLQYLVRLIMSNDMELLDFRKDLVHVSSAENIILDSLIADIKSLEDELTGVLETAKAQADQFEAEGRVQPFSIQELKEQKTAVRKIDHVPQYNQMQHLTGRTSMERFVLNADHAIKNAVELAASVKESYAGLLDFMCESESMASNDFFGTMRRFANEFDKAREQVEKEEKAKKREMAKASRKVSPKQKTSPSRGSPAASSPLAAENRLGFSYSGGAKAEEGLGDQICRRRSDSGLIDRSASEEQKERPDRPIDVGADETVFTTEPFTTTCKASDVETTHRPLSRESSAGVSTSSTAEQAVSADVPVFMELGANIATSPSGEAGTSPEALEHLLHLPSGDADPTAKDIALCETTASPADQLVVPNPGSIAQLAAAAAAKRTASRTNDSPEISGSTVGPQRMQVIDSPPNSPSRIIANTQATSQTDDSPERLRIREEQEPGAPASPQRSQVIESPPNSPSRIASMLATKLFGWPTPKEPEDDVEEVDV